MTTTNHTAEKVAGQEPVAWQFRERGADHWVDCPEKPTHVSDRDFEKRPLYVQPQPQPHPQTDAARDVLTRAKRMLEGYADSYASMERQCQMNGDEGRVSCTAVMHDIRNNMAGWIDREIERLERAKEE